MASNLYLALAVQISMGLLMPYK